MMTKKPQAKVFTLRLSDKQREILNKAAEQSNRPPGNYLVHAALEMATKAA
jgi:uncharacterized protein (DUF1778 family)